MILKQTIIFKQTQEKIIALFITLLLTHLDQKLINHSLQNGSLKFIEKLTFGPFWFNHNSQRSSNVVCRVNNYTILALKASKEGI